MSQGSGHLDHLVIDAAKSPGKVRVQVHHRVRVRKVKIQLPVQVRPQGNESYR